MKIKFEKIISNTFKLYIIGNIEQLNIIKVVTMRSYNILLTCSSICDLLKSKETDNVEVW